MQVVEKRTGTARTYDKFMGKLQSLMLTLGMDDQDRVVFKDVKGYHSYVDPTDPNLVIHSFLVNIRNYPLNLINDSKHNCRTDGLKLGKEHLRLKDKIASNNVHLSLEHSGVTVSTEGEVSQRGGVVTINEAAFIRNGGHSTRILQELAVEDKLPKNQFIKVEVVEGKLTRMQSVNFSIARNTGKPLDARSANNLSGKFNWMQDRLRDRPYAGRIAYQQGQDDKQHPIDIKEILQLLDITNASKYKAEDTANFAMLHPRIVMSKFDEFSDSFKAMSNILPDLLELRDGIQEIMLDALGSNLGTKKYSYFALVKKRGAFIMPFSGKAHRGQINGGTIAPFMSTLRVFMQVRGGEVSWRGGWNVPAILNFYRNIMGNLIEMTVRNPEITNASDMARNSTFWSSLYNKVDAAFVRLK